MKFAFVVLVVIFAAFIAEVKLNDLEGEMAPPAAEDGVETIGDVLTRAGQTVGAVLGPASMAFTEGFAQGAAEVSTTTEADSSGEEDPSEDNSPHSCIDHLTTSLPFRLTQLLPAFCSRALAFVSSFGIYDLRILELCVACLLSHCPRIPDERLMLFAF